MNMTRTLVLAAILAFPGFALYAAANPSKTDVATAKHAAKAKTAGNESGKYEGYAVDGSASASKLAAQRSHTVAGREERNFAIFTGITVIFIIYFIIRFEFFDK
jgi:hypothetical protein